MFIINLFNIEAEKAFLGAILLNDANLNNIIIEFSPDYFYRNNHKIIYKNMLALFKKKEKITLITLTEQLENKNVLELVGGISYITDLSRNVVCSAEVFSYLRIIKEKALRRNICNLADNLNGIAQSDKTIDEIVDLAGKKIMELVKNNVEKPLNNMQQDVMELSMYLEDRIEHKGTMAGLHTGFKSLDKILLGLKEQNMIILAARPSLGKTSLALNIAYNIATTNVPVGIFSLEMSTKQLLIRMVSATALVDSRAMELGQLNDEEKDRIWKTLDKISQLPISISEETGLNLIKFRAVARKMKHEKDIKILIVDYLQLLCADDKKENRQNEIATISRGIKDLARELNIPIIALSQLSRNIENRADKRPILSDLKESGAIEQDADIVLFLSESNLYANNDTATFIDLTIAKNRNGQAHKVIPLYFYKTCTRFTEKIN